MALGKAAILAVLGAFVGFGTSSLLGSKWVAWRSQLDCIEASLFLPAPADVCLSNALALIRVRPHTDVTNLLWGESALVLIYALAACLATLALMRAVFGTKRRALRVTLTSVIISVALIAGGLECLENWRTTTALAGATASVDVALRIAAVTRLKWWFTALAAVAMVLAAIIAVKQFMTPERRTAWRVRFLAVVSPGWLTIRAWSQSKAFRFSGVWLVLVPLIVTLLQNLGEAKKLFPNCVPCRDLLQLVSLPLNLFLLYLCAMLAGLGIACYRFRCPNLIRDFEDAAEFTSKGNGGSRLIQAIKDLVHAQDVAARELALNLFDMSRLGYLQPEMLPRQRDQFSESIGDARKWLDSAKVPDNSTNDAFMRIRSLEADVRPLARSLSVLCFAGAFGILGFFFFRGAWRTFSYWLGN